MAEYIDKWKVVDALTALENEFQQYKPFHGFEQPMYRKLCEAEIAIGKMPAADVVEVVRCQNCIHAEPFDRNCALNTSAYLHCRILRGEEVKNVWHKYKKYYKDYSVVDRFGFCSDGVKMDGDEQ